VLFFGCAPSTCRAVQPVSNVECRITARYAKRVRDLPWQGRQGEIHLQRRRFRCRNKGCARKIFAESLPAVAARKARETMHLCEIVGLVGYALGGLPEERLPDRLGIKSSDDTVLRRVKGRRRGAIQPAVRALSVDGNPERTPRRLPDTVGAASVGSGLLARRPTASCPGSNPLLGDRLPQSAAPAIAPTLRWSALHALRNRRIFSLTLKNVVSGRR